MIDKALVFRALAYDPRTGVFTWLENRGPIKAGTRAGRLKSDGYRYIQIGGRDYPEHHIAWLFVTGGMPDGQIDHENLDKADNRAANLRPATRAQQQANTRLSSRNRHGAKGLKWRADRKKWRVEIYVDGRPITVGHFADKAEAAAAYEAAARRYYGEFARVA